MLTEQPTCNSIFDSITDIADVRTKINTNDFALTDNEAETVSVLSILEKSSFSHVSVDTLLRVIFSEDDDFKYQMWNSVQQLKDVAFYSYILNRFFIPKCSRTVTVSIV